MRTPSSYRTLPTVIIQPSSCNDLAILLLTGRARSIAEPYIAKMKIINQSDAIYEFFTTPTLGALSTRPLSLKPLV